MKFLPLFLIVVMLSALHISAQTTPPPRKVMWLHGRGEAGQTYWHRFADDILRGRKGESDVLWRFDYITIDGYDSGDDISATANDLYSRRISTTASLSLTNRANNPIFIGHSQGGIIARELDRRIVNGSIVNAAPMGGIITVGSPNYGVGLLAARQRITAGKNDIQYASEQVLADILPGPAYDLGYGMSAFAFLGTEFLFREICVTENNLGDDIVAYARAIVAGALGLTVGRLAQDLKPLWVGIVSLASGRPLNGPYLLPGGQDLVAWLLPTLAASIYNSLELQFLINPSTGTIDISTQQMAPAATPGFPSILPSLNSLNTSTPRAAIYGTAANKSPVRLLSNQIGRSTNITGSPMNLTDINTKILDVPISITFDPLLKCRIIEPNEYILPEFSRQTPERQTFNAPDDTRLLKYVNRLGDIYHGGFHVNRFNGYLTLPIQGLLELTKLAPTAFATADAWERGARFFDNELQNTYSYLIGASRVVNTTQRRTIIGYRCPSSRALLNVPDSPDCVMEITEIDEPVSYIVSTGDDGFIAENDQKIPLRDAAVRDIRFENNFQAGDPKDPNPAFSKSCNHFIEGNHPKVHQQLQFLLTTDDNRNPFYVPR